MRIFLSWSGKLSYDVADLLHDWLPQVIQSLEPWIAKTDIGPGDPFREILRRALDEISFGILCLTEENYKAPWVLFEAGALARASGTTLSREAETAAVCPYLIDLDAGDLADPLKDLHAVYANRDGTLSLVRRINKAIGKGNLLKEQLDRSFNRCWREFDDRLSKILNVQGPRYRTEEFFIINKESNRCLQPDGHTDGSSITLAPFTGELPQRWSFHEVGPGLFAIISTFSNRCLDVKDEKKEPDTIVHQWEFIGKSHQKWKIEEGEGESYRFQNVNSGHYLSVENLALKQISYAKSNVQCWWLRPRFFGGSVY